ncbi:lactosylceramide 1,3-N-acetyl-beta-D-glucosaminyltransferase-like [Plodia interpunctella]|uniref:lactosylceramide 1,3-N-acetyl-beta-D-glucosaminyltransferase-like n=1 Tax=Plodia interpunctella TaxID=58824 RepID=UPI002368051E|nr:lactosylceramide 1,3-N-acetyl-beta-D-glucosaminyltransferase-like [Plodia interpunctella]
MATFWAYPCSLAIITSVLLSNITTQLVSDRYVAGYEVSHPELCPAFGSELQLMIFITSAPSHFKQRQAIRKTWGNALKMENVSLAFIIGIPESRRYSDRSRILEDFVYRDIIIGRFIDTYNNLTLKSISMFEWLQNYCPLVPRMLKTDDDVFIHVPKLLELLQESLRENKKKTIWGKLYANRLPQRSKTSKYFVTYEEYPDEVYPNFVSGPAYLMTTDITKDLLVAAANEPYLRFEDVFITGILAEKLFIERIHVEEFFNKRLQGDLCRLMNYISVHGITCTELHETWRNLQLVTCTNTKSKI